MKPGHRVALINPPPHFDRTLGKLPDGIEVASGLSGRRPNDVIVLFADSVRTLENAFERAAARLDESGGLWVAWPKKSSGVKTDLTEDAIRAHGLPSGLVDNKVCAIDDTWSGLRFVVRVKDRKARSK